MMERVVDVFWIARYDYEARWALRRHRLDFFQLICIIDGSGTMGVGEDVFEIADDQVYFLPPNKSHGLLAD